jgi:hypothetical protein
VENTPQGFPRLAAFQASDANFSLYRSFSYLHSRLLLDLQDEITTLEEELDEIDLKDSENDPGRLKSREDDVTKAAKEGSARNRRVILSEIRTKLMEYGTSSSFITPPPPGTSLVYWLPSTTHNLDKTHSADSILLSQQVSL